MPNGLTISTAPILSLLTACLLLSAITQGSCRDSAHQPWHGIRRRMHGGLMGHARPLSQLPHRHNDDEFGNGRGSSVNDSEVTDFRHQLLRRFRLTQEAEGAVVTKCPAGCSKKGTCNEELGRCDCPRHLSGPDCSQEANNIR